MDQEVINSTLLSVVEQTFNKMNAIIPSAPTETKTVDIVEYDDRMRVSGVERFNASSYISVVNFYITQADMQKRKGAKGAFILYFDFENAGKLYKSLGFPAPDDEDDVSMMNCNGEVCKALAENFKNEIVALGFPNLFLSEPDNYKNTSLHGVDYSRDQKTKTEITFTYFKRKTIIVELSLAPIKK